MRSSVLRTTDFGSVGRRLESCRISKIIDFDMIGEKIKKRRLELKMSQKELADKVGMSWQSISNLERPSGMMPTVANLAKICEVLGLKIDLVYN